MERKHKKITEGMSDRQRYRVLTEKQITLVSADLTKLPAPEIMATLNKVSAKHARPIIKTLAREFGIMERSFFNKDIEIGFEYSFNNLEESIQKQQRRYDDFAKMLTCFDGVVENAVGIAIHKDRYSTNNALKAVYVLNGAFLDNRDIVPVKMVVKNLVNRPNKLYIAVSQKRIEANVHAVASRKSKKVLPQLASNIISISQLAENINPIDGNFLKYFPDLMLNPEQKAAKAKALVAEEKYTAEKKAARELKQSLRQGSGKDVGEVQKTFGGSPSGVPEQPKITQRKSLSKNNVKKPQKVL